MIMATAVATPSLVAQYLVCAFIGALEVAILWQIFDGTIDLSRLISEPTGDASMARFQFLVFTFVISLSLFLVIVSPKDGPAFPATIPGGILTLLGISGSSYAVGKAIQFSDPAGVDDRPVMVAVTPSTPLVRYGKTQQFTAEVARRPDAKVKWEVTAGRGSIDPDSGLYRAPDAPLPAPPPTPQPATAPGQAGTPAAAPTQPPHEHATITATCVDFSDVTDLAVITLG